MPGNKKSYNKAIQKSIIPNRIQPHCPIEIVEGRGTVKSRKNEKRDRAGHEIEARKGKTIGLKSENK